MAKRKSSGDGALGILIILGVIVWAIYAAVRVLINLNERFIEAAFGPSWPAPWIPSTPSS